MYCIVLFCFVFYCIYMRREFVIVFIVLFEDKRINYVIFIIAISPRRNRPLRNMLRVLSFWPLYTGYSSSLLLINYEAFNSNFFRN